MTSPTTNQATDDQPAPGVLKLNEEGFVTFDFNGTPVKVDLYRANNRLVRIREQSESNDATESEALEAENQAVAEYMGQIGFGDVSHRTALQFMVAIFAAVGDIRKKDSAAASVGTSAASAGSTGSPSTT